MQQEIDLVVTPRPIQILGINNIGQEAGNTLMTANHDLPWLQDVVGVQIWTLWGASLRDVKILDENNQQILTYNLIANPLNDPANFDELKQILLDAAQ